MTGHDLQFIGRGVYSPTEVHRLTNIPLQSIQRWTRGYSVGGKRYSAVIEPEQTVRGKPALTFLDLIEVRFLDAFRKYGVSWKAIRLAAKSAKSILKTSHPFSSSKFKTDGRTIMMEFVQQIGDKVLIDLVRNQYEFEKIISPYLYTGLVYREQREPQQWFPLKDKETIVIDPARQFGAPIVAAHSIPTRTLLHSYESLQSYDAVARWFDISPELVRDAVEFEKGLAN